MAEEPELDVLLSTEQTFPPPPRFAAEAEWSDPAVYERAAADPEAWWAGWAEKLEWIEPWQTVLDWSDPASREVVRGRQAERQRQLPRPSRGRRQGREGRLPLGG